MAAWARATPLPLSLMGVESSCSACTADDDSRPNPMLDRWAKVEQRGLDVGRLEVRLALHQPAAARAAAGAVAGAAAGAAAALVAVAVLCWWCSRRRLAAMLAVWLRWLLSSSSSSSLRMLNDCLRSTGSQAHTCAPSRRHRPLTCSRVPQAVAQTRYVPEMVRRKLLFIGMIACSSGRQHKWLMAESLHGFSGDRFVRAASASWLKTVWKMYLHRSTHSVRAPRRPRPRGSEERKIRDEEKLE